MESTEYLNNEILLIVLMLQKQQLFTHALTFNIYNYYPSSKTKFFYNYYSNGAQDRFNVLMQATASYFFMI